jgi:hypothetical protein
LEEKRVANPDSTLGEAIGTLVELEVNRLLRPIAEENGCVYVTGGPTNVRTGKPTKLLLRDSSGNEYQIDSVIANTRMQPLVLIESKYIRYTKHNRDKGSWVCTAHYSLRHTFPTIRKSIAILAGNWSGPSKALMESFDVSLFEVSFSKIVETLAQYGVDIRWEEKERERAELAWKMWSQLSNEQYSDIAHKLLLDIEPYLRESMKVTLDTAVPREVSEVELIIETNLGESRYYIFNSIDAAIEFLEGFDEQEVLNNEDGPSLWPTSPTPHVDTLTLPLVDTGKDDLEGEDAGEGD